MPLVEIPNLPDDWSNEEHAASNGAACSPEWAEGAFDEWRTRYSPIDLPENWSILVCRNSRGLPIVHLKRQTPGSERYSLISAVMIAPRVWRDSVFPTVEGSPDPGTWPRTMSRFYR